LDYSIIIPVFNKAALTRQCLDTIRATLEGAGEGEIIVVDNASSDETPALLRAYPWIRVIRNEENRGFAGANNQGAALARGKFLVLLNNDIVARKGWLASMLKTAREPNVGAVGARLLFPNGTIQHAGVRLSPGFGLDEFVAFHELAGAPGDLPEVCTIKDLQAVTAACLLTPRDLYERTGGLDEGFWNGYEDVDYCLKVREQGLRVVYDGGAVLTHFESQSGAQRFRKVAWNMARLAHRWNGRIAYDAAPASIERGIVRRLARIAPGVYSFDLLPLRAATILCHGADAGTTEIEATLRANRSPIEKILYVRTDAAIEAAREEMELRGDRYLAFVDARCRLQPGWFDHLVAQAEATVNTGASTFAPPLEVGQNIAAAGADARCTLLRLSQYPQHLRLQNERSIHVSLSNFLRQGVAEAHVGIASSAQVLGEVPPPEEGLESVLRSDVDLREALLRKGPKRRPGLVSIVMLSWNAVQFTRMALDSIRRHTRGDYEVIVVDNGSAPETVQWLRTLADVRVIFNKTNRGYAGGNNQAFAAARGEYVVLLNNDVIVTEDWLDDLLAAFDRIPALGVSAPRSNKIAGDQVVVNAGYANLDEMHAFAQKRRERLAGQGYLTDRAIGLCLCIDRRVIEEIGGIDERFGVGNFEDDDFCLRVRAAGYRIFVCDDVFIHHFGSQTFAANKVDYTATMRENWRKFAKKWDYPQAYPDAGYPTGPPIARGFDRARHYVPLLAAQEDEPAAPVKLAFVASVSNERDWHDVGAFVRRYVQAFTASDQTLLRIHTAGGPGPDELGRRVEKLLARLGVDSEQAPDVEIYGGAGETIEALHVVEVRELTERSPSALRRVLEGNAP
jgi:GT2 family glycosyltransferase